MISSYHTAQLVRVPTVLRRAIVFDAIANVKTKFSRVKGMYCSSQYACAKSYISAQSRVCS